MNVFVGKLLKGLAAVFTLGSVTYLWLAFKFGWMAKTDFFGVMAWPLSGLAGYVVALGSRRRGIGPVGEAVLGCILAAGADVIYVLRVILCWTWAVLALVVLGGFTVGLVLTRLFGIRDLCPEERAQRYRTEYWQLRVLVPLALSLLGAIPGCLVGMLLALWLRRPPEPDAAGWAWVIAWAVAGGVVSWWPLWRLLRSVFARRAERWARGLAGLGLDGGEKKTN